MVDAPDLKSVVRIGRGSSSLPLGTKSKYIFDKMIRLGDVAKWLTQWFAKPPFMGSNPIVASKILELGKYKCYINFYYS